jgi:hypothetical protein
MTQWHPLFAKLLRPLVEGQYEVQTNVPVGDAPRAADILLRRRTSTAGAPFQGLWRWLTTTNVLEFKGPSVSARVGDLALLVELGLGIDRRLNEERARQRQPHGPREETPFWYLANHLGRRFLRDARELLGELDGLAAGVWQTRLLRHPLLLVSSRELPVERDTMPVHLLEKEGEANTHALAQLLGSQPDLWKLYGSWIVTAHPTLWQEVRHMARAKVKFPEPDFNRVLDEFGMDEIVRQVGLERIVNEIGIDRLLAQLTPEQLREALRRRQETPPTAE